MDRNLEEDFVQMTHDDSDTGNWEAFCVREGKRLARRNRDWINWLEESDQEDPTGEVTRNVPKGLRNPPAELHKGNPENPGPSATLSTHPQRTTRLVSVITDPRKPGTTEVVARRSTRIRRLTEKGLYGEEEKRRRTYQRRETAVRTVTKRTKRPRNDEEQSGDAGYEGVYSFCIRIRPGKQERMEMEQIKEGESGRHATGPTRRNRSRGQEKEQGGTEYSQIKQTSHSSSSSAKQFFP